MKNLFLSTLVIGLGLIAATTDCLHAAIFTVTTANISGPGSLPVAIAQANATPGDNQIQISEALIVLGLQLPTITNSVAITGTASAPSIISGGGSLPLFTFAAGTTNSLSNLVLQSGYTTNSGAAISNASTLFVNGCVIKNHIVINSGGAIINSGVMAISASVISGNQAGYSGGAIFNSGTMTLNNSQMSANSAVNGGAIFNTGSLAISILTMSNNLATGTFGGSRGGSVYNSGNLSISQATFVTNNAICSDPAAYGGALFDAGTVEITNSTFFGNSVFGSSGIGNYINVSEGGAMFEQGGNCTLVNCTVANNFTAGGGGSAGGIFNFSGTVSLLNTIVAGNHAQTGSPDLNGTFVSSGSNLIGNNQGATNLSIFDFQNVSANLGTLQNNGGATPTCVPLPGSYAIGYGTSAGAPTTDQRGVPRPQNGAFDIGAVQVVTNSPFVTGAAMVSGSGFSLNTIFDATNRYRVQASTNLTAWTDLITNGSGGGIYFIDPAATNLNRRYYRTATP